MSNRNYVRVVFHGGGHSKEVFLKLIFLKLLYIYIYVCVCLSLYLSIYFCINLCIMYIYSFSFIFIFVFIAIPIEIAIWGMSHFQSRPQFPNHAQPCIRDRWSGPARLSRNWCTDVTDVLWSPSDWGSWGMQSHSGDVPMCPWNNTVCSQRIPILKQEALFIVFFQFLLTGRY